MSPYLVQRQARPPLHLFSSPLLSYLRHRPIPISDAAQRMTRNTMSNNVGRSDSMSSNVCQARSPRTSVPILDFLPNCRLTFVFNILDVRPQGHLTSFSVRFLATTSALGILSRLLLSPSLDCLPLSPTSSRGRKRLRH